MTKEALQEILHVLELDYEAEPTLVYVFYVLPDGRVDNFSISVRHGAAMNREQLESLMHREYPATRQGKVLAVEKPTDWKPMVEWLDSTEVCRLLHISRKTLWKWSNKKLLTPSKVEGRIYYDRAEIDRLIQSNAITENGRLDKTANC